MASISSPTPLRTLHPASQQLGKRAGTESPTEDARHYGKRIKGVTQACKDCRRNKAKCDGARPTCGPCVQKGRDCGYEGELGQSRQAALKARLETLEKLFESLHSWPPGDAERLLQRIRSADALPTMLGSGADGLVDGPSAHPTASRPLTTESGTDRSVSRHLSFSGSLSGQSDTTRLGGGLIADASTPLISFVLPNSAVTTRAVHSFFASASKLFQVFSRQQVASCMDEIFGPGSPSASPKKAVCCVACVAGIGVQYNPDRFENGLDEVFYHIARHYFVDVLEHCPLEAIKVCTLLAMFNIMNKATVSVAYIEAGLGMFRRYSLNDRYYWHPGLNSEKWTDYRATWRCLIFFSTWLSSTLGYIAIEDVPRDALLSAAEAELDGSTDIVDTVQIEMTKISILQADILRMHLAFKDLTVLAIESTMRDLQNWYNQLPEAMSLMTLGQGDLPDNVRRSIYYVHLLYLGAVMLLYRRVASQYIRSSGVDHQRDTLWKPLEQLMLNHAEQGVLAAKTSSRVLGLLLGQTGCFKRCWVVIFQAYTSCLVLLQCVAQKQVHQMPPAAWEEELAQARTCLDALEYCGTLDQVALRFHGRLLQAYTTLSRHTFGAPSPAGLSISWSASSSSMKFFPTQAINGFSRPGNPVDEDSNADLSPHPFAYLLTMPASGDPESVQLSLSLLRTLSRPYENPDSDTDAKAAWDDIEVDMATSPQQRQSYPQIDAPTERSEWDMDNTLTYYWTPAELAIPDTIVGQVVTGAARFLGSTAPSGWSTAV